MDTETGVDIIVGLGEIESNQLLVDHELAGFCERIFRGVDTSPEKELFEDIAATGPGGNFLKRKSTRLAARSDEFFYPLLTDRHTPEKWAEAGKPTIYTKAREKVEQILAGPLIDPLPEPVCAGLDKILLRADRELAK